jgi:hypothetical protein
MSSASSGVVDRPGDQGVERLAIARVFGYDDEWIGDGPGAVERELNGGP